MPLSDVSLPKIDKIAAQRILAPRFMQNVAQQLIWRDGLGLTGKFSDDVMGAQIRIVRQKYPDQLSRTLGDGEGDNNAAFNSFDAEQPVTEEYSLPLIEVYDRNNDIRSVSDDMLPLGLLNQTASVLEKHLARIINAHTAAVLIAAALNHDFDVTDDGGDSTLIEYDEANDNAIEKIAEVMRRLDEGAEAHGQDTFPYEGRLGVFTPYFKHELFKADGTMFEVGSSRAVELLEIGSAGGLEPVNTEVEGYFGRVHNVPMQMMAAPLWKIAAKYMWSDGDQLEYETDPEGDDGTDQILAIYSAAEATGRGIAFQNRMKIIDNPRGAGLRLQPDTRWGTENWMPEGVVLIVKDGFTNPVAAEADKIVVEGPDTYNP